MDSGIQITFDLQIYNFHEFPEDEVNKTKYAGGVSPNYPMPENEIHANLKNKVHADVAKHSEKDIN